MNALLFEATLPPLAWVTLLVARDGIAEKWGKNRERDEAWFWGAEDSARVAIVICALQLALMALCGTVDQ